MARTLSLNPVKFHALVDAARDGCSNETAAGLVGIHVSTLYRWVSDGEKAEEGTLLREFYEEYTRARALCEQEHIGYIRDAAKKGDPKASMWMLERRNAGYSKKEEVEHSGTVDVVVAEASARAALRKAASEMTDAEVGVEDDPVAAAREG